MNRKDIDYPLIFRRLRWFKRLAKEYQKEKVQFT